MLLKKTFPFLLTLGISVFTFTYFFLNNKFNQSVWDTLVNWAIIVSGAAVIVGIISLLRTHYKKVKDKKDPHRFYSAVLLFSFAFMVVSGLFAGTGGESLFNQVFMNVLVPLESTMFALLAFYMTSAAFRSFRLKNMSATLLLLSAIIVMLAQIPAGEMLYSQLPLVKDWILDYPNIAAQRAILMGMAIGAVATSLRIILGVDKTLPSSFAKK